MSDDENNSDDPQVNENPNKGRKLRVLGKRGVTKQKTKRAKFQSRIF